MWAVGGQSAGNPFVWRYRGTAFETVTGLPTELDTGTVWKVTGRGANDVWFSCSRGIVMHWNGTALSHEMIGGTGESLFSIGCNATTCVTAGTNTTNGVLYENAGTGWVANVPTNDGPVWRGVTPTSEQQYVVGVVGSVLKRTGSSWTPEPQDLTDEAFHAAWGDPQGNVFAVGGKFDRAITTDGVMIYKGTAEVPSLPEVSHGAIVPTRSPMFEGCQDS